MLSVPTCSENPVASFAGDAQQDFFSSHPFAAPAASILLFLLSEAIQWFRICGLKTTDSYRRFSVAEIRTWAHFDEQGVDGA